MYKLYLAIALSFISVINAFGQGSKPVPSEQEVINKIIEIGTTDNRAMDHLDILSNRFGGRLLGSDAYSNAADWCVYMFKKWGLEVVKQEVGELPVGFNRGPWFGKMIGGSNSSLNFTTPSYTSGTKGVQRGHVLREPKTRAEFERMKKVLNGAWVLIGGKNRGWPIDYSESGDSLRATIIARNEIIEQENNNIRAYNRSLGNDKTKLPKEIKPLIEEPALFYKEMRDAGILGIIQASDVPITTLYDRKNIQNMTFETLPIIPDIKLDKTQYAEIAEIVDRREYLQLEFEIRNHFKMGPVKYHNILGIIRGTEYPDEYILSGGHLDAFDVGTGGVDCGSGITPNMEAARLITLAGGRPKRSIMFCLWAGEEFGLWGSKYFVENCDYLDNISNYFNRDGGPTVPMSITVPEAMYENFVNACEPINKINKDFPFDVKKRTTPPPAKPTTAGSSDHAYFVMNGVPAIGFNTGDPKGYNFSYGEIWHTGRDTYNKSIPEYQDQTAVVIALTTYGLANQDTPLSREGLFAEPAKETPKTTKRR